MRKLLTFFFCLLIPVSALSETKVFGQAKISGAAKVTAKVTTGGSSSTLNAGLIAFYKLNEATAAARVDSSGGGNNLADNNSVTQQTGIGGSGNSAGFNGTNQFLSHVDTSALRFGSGNWTVAAWAYIADRFARYCLVCKDNTTAGNQEFQLLYLGDNGYFETHIYRPIDDYSLVGAVTFGRPSNNTWHLVVTSWDSGGHIVSISVDGGTVETYSMGTFVQVSGTAPFQVGASASAGSEMYLSGRVQYVGKWSRVLTSGEISELYNGGAGKTCCPL